MYFNLSYQLSSSRENNRIEKEKEQIVCQMDDLYRRLRKVEHEFEETKVPFRKSDQSFLE